MSTKENIEIIKLYVLWKGDYDTVAHSLNYLYSKNRVLECWVF